MSILINPGAGIVNKDLGFEQAYKNILQFIKDCEIPLEATEAKLLPDESGRYNFTLKAKLNVNMHWSVDMPSLSLEKIRYMGEETQNIWDFPRLYVNGSSWVWKYATIKKDEVVETLQLWMDDYKKDADDIEEIIKQLES